jgi:molecular chaperone GrpE
MEKENECEESVETPPTEMEKLQAELEEARDKYLRVLAESENARKRLIKEKQEMTRFAVENIIAEILLPIDNLENALKFTGQMSEETKNWAVGFNMILSQFKDVLNEHGVVAFHSEGNFYDAHMHEAVEVEETDEHPEGTIIKEFLKGYKCGDRTLRPARVKVARAPKQDQEQE